jgi:kynureninase
MKFTATLEFAKQLDQQDPLQKRRDSFYIPLDESGKPKIYFTGNSLGLQPKHAQSYIDQEMKDWADMGSKGHLHAQNPWLHYHKLLKKGLAAVVGAQENEVSAMQSLTTNLHLMMTTFFRPTPKRHKILMLRNAFPSDQYAIKSQLRFHGLTETSSLIQIGPKASESIVDIEELYKTIEQHGNEIALILIEGVSYLTGQFFDLKKITELGHQQGCKVGFDLAHAVGNVPLQLHNWNVDFAVWCNYKYLNSGPGSVAGCFVHEKYSAQKDLPRLEGWWGHDESRRFLMEPDFQPMEGVDAWQLSNVPIISAALLRASLAMFDEVGMDALRKKSILLTGYLEFLLKEHCNQKLKIITPSDPNQRGCQLSVAFESGGKAIFDRLITSGVSCDWREPNVIRAAPVPMYNSFEDVYQFVQVINQLKT